MARSEQIRHLAVQVASLASLEDVVTHDLQSLLETPSGLIAPISAVEHALPAALLRSRSRLRSLLPEAAPGRSRGSILLSQRRPIGLSVKSCLAAPPAGLLAVSTGWTCTLVAFLLLPVGLLKVPLSLNDPGSPVVWAAHWCFSARSLGPETLTPAHVRWRPSDSALCALVAHAEPLLFLVAI